MPFIDSNKVNQIKSGPELYVVAELRMSQGRRSPSEMGKQS